MKKKVRQTGISIVGDIPEKLKQKRMTTKSEIKKLKIYTIKRLNKMEKLIKTKKKNWLTVNEIVKEYSISRKTFDRLREKGLNVSQPKRNGKILVNRNELETFLNQ